MKKIITLFLAILLGSCAMDNRELEVEFGKIKLNFDIKNRQTEIYFNEIADLDYTINPEFDAVGNKYILKGIVEGGDGVFVYNGKEYKSNTEFEIEKGKGVILYKPTLYDKEKVIIKFILIDKDNSTEIKTLEIGIKKRLFNYTAKKIKDDPLLFNEEYSVITNKIKTEDNTGIIYKLKFTIEGGDGIILFNNIEYKEGDTIPLSALDFNLEYKSTVYDTGKHKVILQVKDNMNQTETQNIEFIIKKRPKILSANVYRNQGIEFNCNFFNNCDFKYNYNILVDAEFDPQTHIKKIEFFGKDRNGNDNYYGTTVFTDNENNKLIQFLTEVTAKPRPRHEGGASFRIRFQDANNEWSEFVYVPLQIKD